MSGAGFARRGLLVAPLAGLVWAARAAALSTPSFIVFFDLNRADISRHGENTLRQFATMAGNFGADADVIVSAHTDSAEASDALSIARGMAVRDRLVALGVPADCIALRINAERQMLVSTGPNTREPQNRRVEIVLAGTERLKPNPRKP